jgi:hypothetical protein
MTKKMTKKTPKNDHIEISMPRKSHIREYIKNNDQNNDKKMTKK